MPSPSNDPFARIAEIMRQRGSTVAPEAFQAAVNVTFHQFESEVYDEAHEDMWESLPPLIAQLVDDAQATDPNPQRPLTLLDIGCGTGLAADSVVRSSFGPRLTHIDLLDTAPAMLARALKRSSTWGVATSLNEGLVEDLAAQDKQFDVIITSSVLHHVPHLPSFLQAVSRLQPAGSVFIHLQDPNGDALGHPELKRRMSVAAPSKPEWRQRLTPARIVGRLKREIAGTQGQDYVSKTIKELVRQGISQTPLTPSEIFAITDIHVQDEEGISIQALRKSLPAYNLVRQRAYGYFGVMPSRLDAGRRAEEEALAARGDLGGFHISAVWRKRSA